MDDGPNAPPPGDPGQPPRRGPLSWIIGLCLHNKLIVGLSVVFLVAWGIVVAPFDWEIEGLLRDPVPVDAIPDTGENQQIVFTRWPGRSPRDVQDQITYPLTAALLGTSGVKTVRSLSMFGFSTIYVIFRESVGFDESRNRILTRLNSLPSDALPEGVRPALGPEATALGQVFWYTLEGRDEQGQPTGGWDPDELRTIQDWYLRYDLLAARDRQGSQPIAEVASVGGFVREYQVDVDPAALRAHGVRLDEVFDAVRRANVDVGAGTIEVNRVEYVVRGLGLIKSVADLEAAVVKVHDNVPILVRHVAHVSLGPAARRGALDKEGTEAVGAVVVVRYGENPLSAIQAVKARLGQLGEAREDDGGAYWLLHAWKKALPDGRVSHVAVVPFYDRTGLIYETLGTLERALTEEILVTILVVVAMVLHLRSSALISGLLPLAVLLCFIAMKYAGVDANVVALSGIAIAIGTIVDMGIVVCENILKRLGEAPPGADPLTVVHRAAAEVGGAVLTAMATTVVSFLPVFAMQAAEGKLFRPLAFTKTFALAASLIVALAVLPPLAQVLFTGRVRWRKLQVVLHALLVAAGLILAHRTAWWAGAIVAGIGAYHLVERLLPRAGRGALLVLTNTLVVGVVAYLLTVHWTPLGPAKGLLRNLLFVGGLVGSLMGLFLLVRWVYEPVLRFCLAHKLLFLVLPVSLVVLGLHAWSGLGQEFMPSLDEGSFLLMPTTMPHASIGECLDVLRKQDMAIRAVPEVASVVGKIGRVESPLDPAPVSMIETVINYKPEYVTDRHGRRVRFRYDEAAGAFARGADGKLVPDRAGRPFRQWRPHIRTPADIWHAVHEASRIPGTTPAPRLQPIETRRIMLQTGLRARLGVKVYGPDLAAIEATGRELERLLRQVPAVDAPTVFAERIVGKPYVEIDVDRAAIARHRMDVRRVLDVVEAAIGGRRLTTTVEGRERSPVRVRYQRELRDRLEALGRILVPAPDGVQIPLGQLAAIRYVRGPQSIKSEDTYLVGYVTFGRKPGYADVDVVEACRRHLRAAIDRGELTLAPGVSYRFAGTHEDQVRASKRLSLILPAALFLIFVILYAQFRAASTTLIVFSGIAVAWSGGFLLLWLYGQPWFLDVHVFGVHMRELFQVHPVNLSVAVWVGFLALFGIATDDGVVMATYLRQRVRETTPATVAALRQTVVEAGLRRVRPCLMTTATTVLALVPVLTATGRGSDVMVPMAIPSFGGMCVEVVTMFVVPVLYCLVAEVRLRFHHVGSAAATPCQGPDQGANQDSP